MDSRGIVPDVPVAGVSQHPNIDCDSTIHHLQKNYLSSDKYRMIAKVFDARHRYP